MLILIAHGSRDPRWRASVEQVVKGVEADVGPGNVRLAYMDLTPPTLLEVASEAARNGSTRIRVLPLFLATEGHVERDVQPLVDGVRARIDLLPPIGQFPEFREILGRITTKTA
jgi:sirohydrochlorin cobaltochelatase